MVVQFNLYSFFLKKSCSPRNIMAKALLVVEKGLIWSLDVLMDA